MLPVNTSGMICLTGDVDHAYDLDEGRLERIFEVLDAFDAKYTFPATAQVFTKGIDKIKQVVDHGDEIAGHGDIHAPFRGQDYHLQKRRMEAMLRAIYQASGLKINGFRAPGLKGDPTTSRVANDLGLLYDSSTGILEEGWVSIGGKWIDTRSGGFRKLLSLYRHFVRKVRSSGSRHGSSAISSSNVSSQTSFRPHRPFYDDMQLNVVTIPVSKWDDYYLIDILKIRDPKKIANIWRQNFVAHRLNGEPYVLLAHPLRIGRRESTPALRLFLEHATSMDDTCFLTLTELAALLRET